MDTGPIDTKTLQPLLYSWSVFMWVSEPLFITEGNHTCFALVLHSKVFQKGPTDKGRMRLTSGA